jgi:peptidoglycan/LPS O-acetylase OafA/YrhL
MGMQAGTSMTRFHDLDALRGFAMLLGILLHAGAFLVPLEFWPVHEAWAWETAPEANVYAWILSVIHGFRMPLFFLLSGFFTAMLWRSRGLQRLWRHRLERIGLPLLAGMFTVVPAIRWLAAGADFTPLDWPLAWLGGLEHLWFLWYLLLLAAAFIVAVRLGLTFRHQAWWLLVPLTVAPQYVMHELAFGPDTESGVIPAGRVFAYYAIFFAFGVFFRQRDIAVRRWWAVALVPSLLLLLPAGVALLYDEGFQYAGAPWVWGVAAVVQVAFAWLMCFGSMGLFRWIFVRERFGVRYLSDASYWLYLTHLPLVIAAQMLVVTWPINIHLKFLLISTTIVAGLLLVYQAGVRYTVIGTVMNGPRFRRASPPAGSMVPRPEAGG